MDNKPPEQPCVKDEEYLSLHILLFFRLCYGASICATKVLREVVSSVWRPVFKSCHLSHVTNGLSTCLQDSLEYNLDFQGRIFAEVKSLWSVQIGGSSVGSTIKHGAQ